MDVRSSESASGRIARGTSWNLAGAIIPSVVAVAVIPSIISALGTDRFGVLTLAWLIAGHFSLFGLGIGRALTKYIAEYRGSGRSDQVPAVFWTAAGLMAILGTFGGMVFAAVAPTLATDVLSSPPSLYDEVETSLYVLAAGLPIVLLIGALRGAFAGYQRFGTMNLIQIPAGVFNYVAPLAVLAFSEGLVPVVAAVVFVRGCTALAYFVVAMASLPGLRQDRRPERTLALPLIKFGGWLTISSVLGPGVEIAERVVIGSAVSVAAIAHYSTPYMLLAYMWILPAALTAALFPEFSAGLVSHRERTLRVYNQVCILLVVLLTPITAIAMLFADEGLALWISAEFAAQASLTLQLLAAGFLMNSLAQISFAMLQAAGRPDLIVKVNLVELPIYLVAVIVAAPQGGIPVVAAIWTVRSLLNLVVLRYLTRRVTGDPAGSQSMILFAPVAATLAVSALLLMTPPAARAVMLIVVITAFGTGMWAWALDPVGKAAAKDLVARAFKPGR